MKESKMKLGHVIYKVDDLDKAVEEYTQKGFTVEYGKSKNPYNALIYFSEGPYLELLERTGMPEFMKKIFSLIGKKGFVNRLNIWDSAAEGLIGLALENDRFDIDRELAILDKANLTYLKGKSGRTDAKGRKLRFMGAFPDDMAIPVFSAKYNINVRPPKGYIQPNGIKRIKSIAFGTKEEFIPIINDLCDDEGLKLFVGSGIRDLEFEYTTKDQ